MLITVKSVGEQGYQAYHMFAKVVKLTVNQRVQGSQGRRYWDGVGWGVGVVGRGGGCRIPPIFFMFESWSK